MNRESLLVLGSALLVQALLAGAVVWVMARRRLSWAATFGLHRDRLEINLLTGAGAAIAMIPLLALVAVPWQMLLRSLGFPIDDQPVILWLLKGHGPLAFALFSLVAVLLVPVCEELFFRGLLEGDLRKRYRPVPAACLTALLFALFHLHLPSLLPLFAIALGFSAVYHATRSLAAAMAMHAVYNSVNLIAVLLNPPA